MKINSLGALEYVRQLDAGERAESCRINSFAIGLRVMSIVLCKHFAYVHGVDVADLFCGWVAMRFGNVTA